MSLECHHIYFNYPGTDKVLFKDLSFHLNEPGLHALFGPSGVGKSSLAKIMLGSLQPTKGRVAGDIPGAAFYTHNLERLPGWSGIGRHLERVTPAHNVAKKDELIRIFGITPLLKHRFSQLSVGQQNRINLVRYLVQDFNLLIMDESLANVDEKLRGRILLALKSMFPDVLFIYISHNVVEVATFCRQIWILRGVHKDPQLVMSQGLDLKRGGEADQHRLQHTMLEIMNAA